MRTICALVFGLLLGALGWGASRADQSRVNADLVCSKHSDITLIRFPMSEDEATPVYPALAATIDCGLSSAPAGHQTDCFPPGSRAPMIALWLLHANGSSLAISIYVSIACVISALSALIARETCGESFATIDAR
jgi:hypothetical protein